MAINENVGIGKDDMEKLKEKLAEAIRQSPMSPSSRIRWR